VSISADLEAEPEDEDSGERQGYKVCRAAGCLSTAEQGISDNNHRVDHPEALGFLTYET
jgi:hypothetical protein